MSKEGNSRREDQIAALHAVIVSKSEGMGTKCSGGMWWVFTSQTATGEWIFTYKEQDGSPGEGWKQIPRGRIDGIVGSGHTQNAGGFIRVGAAP